jgi:hypothetical protein
MEELSNKFDEMKRTADTEQAKN